MTNFVYDTVFVLKLISENKVTNGCNNENYCYDRIDLVFFHLITFPKGVHDMIYGIDFL